MLLDDGALVITSAETLWQVGSDNDWMAAAAFVVHSDAECDSHRHEGRSDLRLVFHISAVFAHVTWADFELREIAFGAPWKPVYVAFSSFE